MSRLLKITKLFTILGLSGAILLGIATAGIYFYLKPNLPSIDSLKNIQLQVPLRIFSKDGLLISEFGEKKRIPLTIDEIPIQMRQAFLAAEDDRFYEHPGVDYQGLLRAAFQLILTGKKKQGGSTITMQVARNFFLSNKKTYLRKLNEILLALKINSELSKDAVLSLYLNKIYLGHRAYGVGAAARIYYGKEASELTLAEIAMIAGLPKAPSSYNPITNPERATLRRDYVLGRMLQLGYINQQEYEESKSSVDTAKLHKANIELEAPYIAEMVRSYMYETYGSNAYTQGYTVYTTVDSKLQKQAEIATRKAVNNYDKRHGYRGIIANIGTDKLDTPTALDDILSEQPVIADLVTGIVTEITDKQAQVYLGHGQTVTLDWPQLKWARTYIDEDHQGKKPTRVADIFQAGAMIHVLRENSEEKGDYWRLAQLPQVNTALVSLDPKTGALNSLIGGYDFHQTKFNRALQARRQPGSGFKAFIYSAALENGFTAASLINDAPVVFEDASLETAWRPENYSGKFFGPTRIRYALTKSRNLVSIRLLRSMGIKNALKHIGKFGFSPEKLPHDLSLALGSAIVTPMQMARGYAVLANGGFLIDPYWIDRIEKSNEGIIFQANPAIACNECEETPPAAEHQETADNLAEDSQDEEQDRLNEIHYAPRVITPENRFIMYSMMQDVITRGTGKRARVLKRKDLAGKTGTTNDQRDAWFNGYNQSIVTIVWVGFDTNQKLGRGEVGGRAALPAWIDFMKVALEDIPDQPPEMPDGMLTIRIDPVSGKLAYAGQKNAIFEVFRAGRAPRERAVAPSTAETTETGNPSSSGQSTTTIVEELF